MGFRQPIAAGVYLVREALRSPGFVTGSFGWTINRDGSSEFNNVTIRGSLQVGSPPNPYIVIDSVGNQAFIKLYSGDPAEVTPAQMRTTATPTSMQFFSPDLGDGYVLQKLQPEVTATATPPSVEWAPGGGNTLTMVAKVFGDLSVQPGGGLGGNGTFTGNVSVGGNTTVTGNSTVSGNFNLTGGIIGGKMVAGDQGISTGPLTTTSTSYVVLGGAGSLLKSYPPSGNALVLVRAAMSSSVGAAGNGAFVSFEIRDTNSGGTLRVAASDNTAAYVLNTLLNQGTSFSLVTGLPTTGTLFIQPMFRSQNAANTATFRLIDLVFIPLP